LFTLKVGQFVVIVVVVVGVIVVVGVNVVIVLALVRVHGGSATEAARLFFCQHRERVAVLVGV